MTRHNSRDLSLPARLNRMADECERQTDILVQVGNREVINIEAILKAREHWDYIAEVLRALARLAGEVEPGEAIEAE